MALAFALTGGIACGKSMAEQCFRAAGCRVLDADAVVRALEARGGAAVAPIIAAFGEGVRAEDGGIERPALAKVVFADATARERLEAIVLPLVRAQMQAWLAEAADSDAISIFSAATLFECGWEKDWAGIVCVLASEATQIRRMLTSRGMTEAAAKARLAAQMPVAEKARRSDWILRNDEDDLPALKAQVDGLVAQWRTGK